MKMDASSTLDVAIIGAGISGINFAYRLQEALPNYSYEIFETRGAVGGTWDLFRYPGIRSDSDLFTFGFEWFQWKKDNPIADGPSICRYMNEAVARFGLDKHMSFHHKVTTAQWSSKDCLWTLTVESNGATRDITARYLVLGTGYYDHNTPREVTMPGLEDFGGTVIQPQFWPEDYDYTGKRVIVVGSGATAVSLVPVLAQRAAQVTMLQRSPTYILSVPNTMHSWIDHLLPRRLAYWRSRIAFIIKGWLLYTVSVHCPNLVRSAIRTHTIKQLPGQVHHDPHFRPRYNPWDQRLCVCPDGDFFKSLHTGRAEIKTGTIERVGTAGVTLQPQDAPRETLEADAIVLATGLKLRVAGGVEIVIDGEKCEPSSRFMWNNVMLQDVPNAAFPIGFINASWTLGADTAALHFYRLVQHLDGRGIRAAVARENDESRLRPVPLFNLNATYVTESDAGLPRAAREKPWQPRSSYFADLLKARFIDPAKGLQLIR